MAAGDKLGNLCFWDTTMVDEESDGVTQLRPHTAVINALQFDSESSPQGLFSFSYDGTVRRLDLQGQIRRLEKCRTPTISTSKIVSLKICARKSSKRVPKN